ncbi:hypothetical protein T11_290 [Trichinella zimbabwensis]|uniref:Uncharacterized protein n=1 Tax=Trichinella zimbabwensis TaxID=268475 RepID=A0A0V1GWM5_9BILA|nr:hypothetical protein T11_290 [Trichinella zimbabwensis]
MSDYPKIPLSKKPPKIVCSDNQSSSHCIELRKQSNLYVTIESGNIKKLFSRDILKCEKLRCVNENSVMNHNWRR